MPRKTTDRGASRRGESMPRTAASQGQNTAERRVFRKKLGAAIRRNRELLGLTRQDLADAIKPGAAQSTIEGYETGRRPVTAEGLYVIAKRLGLPLHELLREVTENERSRLEHLRHYLRVLRRFAAMGEIVLGGGPALRDTLQLLADVDASSKMLRKRTRSG